MRAVEARHSDPHVGSYATLQLSARPRRTFLAARSVFVHHSKSSMPGLLFSVKKKDWRASNYTIISIAYLVNDAGGSIRRGPDAQALSPAAFPRRTKRPTATRGKPFRRRG